MSGAESFWQVFNSHTWQKRFFFSVVLIFFILIILDKKNNNNTAQEKTLVDLSPSHSNENGKRGPQEAQGQDVCLCLLRSDMPRGAQEEKPWDSGQLFRILQKMLWKMEG